MTFDIARVSRLRAWAVRVIRWQPPPRIRQFILAGAGVVFVAATAIAVSELPAPDVEVAWLALAGLLAVAIPVLNALEYVLAGRWLGVAVGMKQALSVTLVASAANLAPLPGAAMVRAKGLLGEGGGAADTGRVLGAVGAGWVSVSLVVAGGAMAVAGRGWAAALAFVAGSAVLVMVPVLLPRTARTVANVVRCVLVELVAVVLQAVRMALILAGIGYEGRMAQTLVLPAAGALGNAAGIVPGGLGLRELVAGGLSPLVELPPAHGVTAAATDRVLSLGVLAVAALGMAAVRRGELRHEDMPQ